LRCIISQLSASTKGLPIRAPVLAWYDRKKKSAEGREPEKLNVDECVQLILALLADEPAFIVLDGLDECNPEQCHELLGALSIIRFQSTTPVKIFVSSRDDGDITTWLHDCQGLTISTGSANTNENDIKNYIEIEIKRAIRQRRLLRGFVSPSLEQLIVQQLYDRSKGM
jgi:hypothetical protein